MNNMKYINTNGFNGWNYYRNENCFLKTKNNTGCMLALAVPLLQCELVAWWPQDVVNVCNPPLREASRGTIQGWFSRCI